MVLAAARTGSPEPRTLQGGKTVVATDAEKVLSLREELGLSVKDAAAGAGPVATEESELARRISEGWARIRQLDEVLVQKIAIEKQACTHGSEYITHPMRSAGERTARARRRGPGRRRV